MKKSNKLLLFTLLLPLVLLAVATLSLFFKYKAGDIITSKQLRGERYERKVLPSTVYLSIKGVNRINVFASDTFSIEFDKLKASRRYKIDQSRAKLELSHPELVYEWRGDTLAITGSDTLLTGTNLTDKEINQPTNVQEVNLYCRDISTLQFRGAQVFIMPDKRPALGAASRVLLEDCTFSLGDLTVESRDTTHYYYEALDINAHKSTVNLNPNTSIGGLRLELDSTSIFSDVSAKIGHADIRFADRTTLNLSGANLRKIDVKNP